MDGLGQHVAHLVGEGGLGKQGWRRVVSEWQEARWWGKQDAEKVQEEEEGARRMAASVAGAHLPPRQACSDIPFRGTSLKRTPSSLGPYSSPMPSGVW